ncbi:MAG: CDP-alcohol phosphatidyltransferase family protein [Deltaproteobacteria bacterium]|jgi:phosphatidylglycerophosphate synthase|nr:CDP-alcohol phosphatidyltransferase family protein [Deltaproteobacteria bacterium]
MLGGQGASGEATAPAVLRWSDLENLPGALTLSRFPLAVVYPFFAPDRDVALALYLLMGVTDFFDGHLARRMGRVSHTGAVFDGWLDKVFHVNAAWSLVNFHELPAWWMLCWFSREIVQGVQIPFLVGRFVRARVRPHHANPLGKATTWMMSAAIIGVLVGVPELGAALTPLIGLTGLLSALAYLRRELADAAAIDGDLDPKAAPGP